MKAENDSCPICSSSEIIGVVANAFDSPNQSNKIRIRVCEKCDFAWQWPIVRKFADSKDYFEFEYHNCRKDSYFDTERRAAVSALQAKFVIDINTIDSTLLDIGCGNGDFARTVAGFGWDVWGVDPALPNSVELESGSTLQFIKGGLESISNEKKFSCITLWDVIEHVEDPEKLIEDAWQFLLPGGWLIIETGNFQSYERILAGQVWWCWQIDHRWYFSPATLTQLLVRFAPAQIKLARNVMRPWVKAGKSSVPSVFQTWLSILKRPWRFVDVVKEHQIRRLAADKWPNWHNLEIFTLAVQK